MSILEKIFNLNESELNLQLKDYEDETYYSSKLEKLNAVIIHTLNNNKLNKEESKIVESKIFDKVMNSLAKDNKKSYEFFINLYKEFSNLYEENFTIIKNLNNRIYLINYKDNEAILKTNLTIDELVPYNDKIYSDKYNFLPKIYKIFNYDGNKAMIMEKLFPFNYLNSEKYIPHLFEELEKFQKETGRMKLDISVGNIMSRHNGEIVLFDLWASGRTEGWISDTIKGNKETLMNVLKILKYQNEIKKYVLDAIKLFKQENLNYSDYGIDRRINKITNLPPSLDFLKKLYIGLKIYEGLKEYLPTINIDIKTYEPPFSGKGLYWEKYDEIENKYKSIKSIDFLDLILKN